MQPFRRLLPLILLFSIAIAAQAQDVQENAEFKLATGLYNDGLYAQAEDQFRVFIDKFPTTSLGIEARFYLGLIQMKTRKFAQARATFQDFAIRYPEHLRAPEAWWNLGEVFAAERNWPEAASAFARLKTFHPRDKRAAQALMQASTYFQKAGDAENARLTLNAILTEYPQSPEAGTANLSLAELLIAGGDFDRALREFKRVQSSSISTDEMRARALVGIGRVNALLGNREEAQARYSEVVTKYPKTVALYDAQLGLGDLHRQFQAYDAAIDSYAAVAAKRQAPAAYRQRAWIGGAEAARDAGKAREAARWYDSLFTLKSDQPIAPSTVLKAADAARDAGDFAAAIARLRLIVDDSTALAQQRVALVRIAETFVAAKRPGDAVQAYQTFLLRWPGDPAAPWVLLAIGDVTERLFGNLTRASELYGSLLDRYGTSPVADRAQFAQARTYESAQRFDAAADAYQQVWRQFPGSTLVMEARQRHDQILRFRRASAGEALPVIGDALAALRAHNDGGAVDLALGRLYLEILKDHAKALTHFQAALTATLTPGDAELAKWGRAMASLRLLQLGEGNRAEAERYLGEVAADRGAPMREDAAWQLFLLRSEGKSAPEISSAAASYFASGAAVHAAEVRLALAEMQLAQGQTISADTTCGAILSAVPGTAVAARALAVRGFARVALGNFQGAAADFRMHEREAPDGERAAEVLVALGRVLARTGQYAEAASTFATLADRFPYSPLADSARIAMTSALSDGGMHERATTVSAAELEHAERNPFISPATVGAYLYAHAVAQARAKNPEAAKRALQRYLEEYPNGPRIADVYFALGQMFKDEGKLPLATAYFQQAGTLGSSPQARLEAADLLLESGRNEEAARAYDAIARDVSGRVERSYALSRAAVALYRADNVADARKRVEEFRTAYPDAEPVFDEFEIERGKSLFRAKKYKDAEEIFDEKSDANSPDIAGMALFWLGRCDEATGDESGATKCWTKVSQVAPGSDAAMEAQLAIAHMAMRAEKYDVAANAFKTVADAPRASQAALKQALNGMITCYDELKLYDAAAEMTKRFLETWPNDPTAFRKRVNLGVFYYQLRYFDQAVMHFQSLLSQATPDDQAEIRYYIGESYFYKGDFTQAALEFLKVPYLVTTKTEIDWSASSYYMAGQSYEKMGRTKDALDMYSKIIATPGVDARYKAQAEKEAARVRALLK